MPACARVELDPAALRQLETRFGADPRVEVVEGDATLLPLPVEPFAVVANLPFAAGTAILRRLLGDPRVPLTQLDAIVEWGLAAKRTAVWPSTLLGCTWGAWYELSLVRRVPRACFAPPPSVDAAVLRADATLGAARPAGGGARATRRCCSARSPPGRRSTGSSRAASSTAWPTSSASTRTPRARDLDARQWAGLYAVVRSATSRPRAAGSRRRRGSRR